MKFKLINLVPIIVAVCIFIIVTSFNVTVHASDYLLIGDVTCNGEVDANDLTALSRYVSKIDEIPNCKVETLADTNQDGKVTADDLTLLSRYVAGIIDMMNP